MKLTTDEVVEACREWLEKHYGIKAGEKLAFAATASYDMRPGQNMYVKGVEVTFIDAPKPAGGPYRS